MPVPAPAPATSSGASPHHVMPSNLSAPPAPSNPQELAEELGKRLLILDQHGYTDTYRYEQMRQNPQLGMSVARMGASGSSVLPQTTQTVHEVDKGIANDFFSPAGMSRQGSEESVQMQTVDHDGRVIEAIIKFQGEEMHAYGLNDDIDGRMRITRTKNDFNKNTQAVRKDLTLAVQRQAETRGKKNAFLFSVPYETTNKETKQLEWNDHTSGLVVDVRANGQVYFTILEPNQINYTATLKEYLIELLRDLGLPHDDSRVEIEALEYPLGQPTYKQHFYERQDPNDPLSLAPKPEFSQTFLRSGTTATQRSCISQAGGLVHAYNQGVAQSNDSQQGLQRVKGLQKTAEGLIGHRNYPQHLKATGAPRGALACHPDGDLGNASKSKLNKAVKEHEKSLKSGVLPSVNVVESNGTTTTTTPEDYDTVSRDFDRHFQRSKPSSP